jgi:hypothetical protein
VRTCIAKVQECSRTASYDAVRRDRDAAQGIMKAIDILKNRLNSAPPELRSEWSNFEADPDRPGTVRPVPYRPEAWVLFREMEIVRAGCERFLSDAPSTVDLVKRQCAFHAWLLVWGVSGSKPVNADANSPFRVIAGCLYEAAEPGRVADYGRPDLRRACRHVYGSNFARIRLEGPWSADLRLDNLPW